MSADQMHVTHSCDISTNGDANYTLCTVTSINCNLRYVCVFINPVDWYHEKSTILADVPTVDNCDLS